MTRRRVLLVVAAALYAGWLCWLGYAVWAARVSRASSPVLSRAQLIAATHLLVVKVDVDESGLPAEKAVVVKSVRGAGVQPGEAVEVVNLPSAMPPGATAFPGPAEYLLPVVGDGKRFSIAGVPRSPGYEPAAPARPAIYKWDADAEAQLRALGLIP